MLSLAPLLILLVAVGSWWLGTDTTTHYLTSRIAELMGPDAARLVDRLAASRDVPPAFHRWGASVGTVITIVGATAAYAELQHALNRIFGELRGSCSFARERCRFAWSSGPASSSSRRSVRMTTRRDARLAQAE